MDGFLELKNRYLIVGKLTPDGGLLVGSGRTGGETDATFMKDGVGYVIPGSSLRGAMRSLVERIVQTVRPECGCVLFEEGDDSKCLTAAKPKEQTAFEKKTWGTEKERWDELSARLCDICKLFGSPFLASKLKVADSRPLAVTTAQIRHGVGINRDTETAEDKIKFNFEVVEKGSQFGFRLELENAGDTDLALIGILLREMTDRGIYLGGKKSRGLGLVRLERGYTVRGFECLRAFLLLKEREMPEVTAAFEARAERAIEEFLAVTHAA